MAAVEDTNDDLVTVSVESGVFEVINTMHAASVRRSPAVDDACTLAGIIPFDDFVAFLGREPRNLGDIVEAESPPYDHV